MTRKDALLRLHERLVAQRDSLRRKLRDEVDEELGGTFSGTGDIADSAADDAQSELSSQLAALESRELRQIEQAIEMMRQGRYGRCDICNGAIPVARLKALPYAPSCVDCQRRQEKRGGALESDSAAWESAFEHEGRMNDRELTMGDIDIDR